MEELFNTIKTTIPIACERYTLKEDYLFWGTEKFYYEIDWTEGVWSFKIEVLPEYHTIFYRNARTNKTQRNTYMEQLWEHYLAH